MGRIASGTASRTGWHRRRTTVYFTAPRVEYGNPENETVDPSAIQSSSPTGASMRLTCLGLSYHFPRLPRVWTDRNPRASRRSLAPDAGVARAARGTKRR